MFPEKLKDFLLFITFQEEFNFILMQQEGSELIKRDMKRISTDLKRLVGPIKNVIVYVLQISVQYGYGSFV